MTFCLAGVFVACRCFRCSLNFFSLIIITDVCWARAGAGDRYSLSLCFERLPLSLVPSLFVVLLCCCCCCLLSLSLSLALIRGSPGAMIGDDCVDDGFFLFRLLGVVATDGCVTMMTVIGKDYCDGTRHNLCPSDCVVTAATSELDENFAENCYFVYPLFLDFFFWNTLFLHSTLRWLPSNTSLSL